MKWLWGDVRSAIEVAKRDKDRIDRVVYLMWRHHTALPSDEWLALKAYVVTGLWGCSYQNVDLSDVVEWACADGEQGGSCPGSWFRAAWAWCVVQGDLESWVSPVLCSGRWQAFPSDAEIPTPSPRVNTKHGPFWGKDAWTIAPKDDWEDPWVACVYDLEESVDCNWPLMGTISDR